MKHIIGRIPIFWFLSSIFFGLSGVSVTLEIADAYGKSINQVIAGIPFQLRVVIKGQNTTGNVPHIEHPQDFVCKRSGIQMHSINGMSTTIYVYTAVAPVAKKYTIGPATIVLNGSSIQAEPIHIEAVQGASHNHSSTQTSRNAVAVTSQPFMECTFNKTEIFLGETTSCILRFYCPSHIQRVTLKQIKGPQLNDMHLVQKGGQKEGVELINKRPFKYIEWEFDIQFLKEGAIAVPPFGADYSIDDEDENTLFGGFSIFFQHNKLRQVQSNTVSITVKPIPEYKGRSVHAVGIFTDFTASLSPTTITVGDAAVLSLRLTGVGNISMLEHPLLTDLPSLVKVYESQHKIEHNSYHPEKTKIFEYIIQAVEQGSVKIPEQSFIFFNPDEKKHVVIKTAAVDLQIKSKDIKGASVSTQTSEHKDNTEHAMSMAPALDEQPLSIMNPIQTVGNSTYQLAISYNQLIWFLVLLMLFLAGYYCVMMMSVFVYRIIQYRFAYYTARKAIKRLAKENKSAQLITVFKKYVASRCSLTQSHEDDLFLTLVIDTLHDQKLIADWKMFYATLMEAAYGTASELYDYHALWRQSYYWLHLLKKKGM